MRSLVYQNYFKCKMDITFILNIAINLDYKSIVNLMSTSNKSYGALCESWNDLAIMKYDYDLIQVKLLRKLNKNTNIYEQSRRHIERRKYKFLDTAIHQLIHHYQPCTHVYIQSDYFWIKALTHILRDETIARQIMDSFGFMDHHAFATIKNIIGVRIDARCKTEFTMDLLYQYMNDTYKIFIVNHVFNSGTRYIFRDDIQPLPNELIKIILSFKKSCDLMLYLSEQKMYDYMLLIFTRFIIDDASVANVCIIFHGGPQWDIVLDRLNNSDLHHYFTDNYFIDTLRKLSNGNEKLIEELKVICK